MRVSIRYVIDLIASNEDIFLIYIHEFPVFLRTSNDYFTDENELTEWVINIFSVTHNATFYTLCN